jgi:prepilin-type N-terminal cleavage/methylation domain-containing protein
VKKVHSSRADGFTFPEVLIVLAIIAMASYLVGPAVMSAVGDTNGRACAINLNLIEAAKDEFRRDNPGVQLTSEDQLAQYLPNGVPSCPAHGLYGNIANLNAACTCSLDKGRPGFHNIQQP